MLPRKSRNIPPPPKGRGREAVDENKRFTLAHDLVVYFLTVNTDTMTSYINVMLLLGMLLHKLVNLRHFALAQPELGGGNKVLYLLRTPPTNDSSRDNGIAQRPRN